jgi:hypothetical protein
VLVYNRFRTNRAEYDRLMAEWRKLIADWKARPAKLSNGSVVIDWLERSLHRLQYDEIARLPELPDFGSPPPLPMPPPERHHVPLHPASPRITARQENGAPTIAPPLGNLAKTIDTTPPPRPPIDPPRIAHRAEKPPIPQTATPPRAHLHSAQPVIAPPDSPPRIEAEPTTIPVMVDLEELSVRIRGYNLALKELTANLHAAAVWTPEELRNAFDQFEDLTARRSQIVLYRNLITGEDRQLVGNPLSLDSSIALLGGKIFAARTRLSRDGDAASAKAQLEQLDTLSRKLAQLAAERAQ